MHISAIVFIIIAGTYLVLGMDGRDIIFRAGNIFMFLSYHFNINYSKCFYYWYYLYYFSYLPFGLYGIFVGVERIFFSVIGFDAITTMVEEVQLLILVFVYDHSEFIFVTLRIIWSPDTITPKLSICEIVMYIFGMNSNCLLETLVSNLNLCSITFSHSFIVWFISLIPI